MEEEKAASSSGSVDTSSSASSPSAAGETDLHPWLYAYLDWTLRRQGRFWAKKAFEKLRNKEMRRRYPSQSEKEIKRWFNKVEWSPLQLIGISSPLDLVRKLPLEELEIWAFDPSKETLPKGKGCIVADDYKWPPNVYTPKLQGTLGPWVVPSMYPVGTVEEFQEYFDLHCVPLWGNTAQPDDVIHVLGSGFSATKFFSLAGKKGLENDMGNYEWRTSSIPSELFSTREFRSAFEGWFLSSLSQHLPPFPQSPPEEDETEKGFFEIFECDFYLGYQKGSMAVAGRIRPRK